MRLEEFYASLENNSDVAKLADAMEQRAGGVEQENGHGDTDQSVDWDEEQEEDQDEDGDFEEVLDRDGDFGI